MAYVEAGAGDPVIFLHGNPTSSYLWRNIIPHVQSLGRCIAPDLIGMGDSDKLPESGPERYTFAEHRGYLDGLLDALGVKRNVTFVVHDWGSALGFDWACRHPDAVKGIVHMEGIVKPPKMAELPEQAQQMFQAFRSPAGDEMVLQQNMFVEQVLPSMILRDLSEEEMNVYRQPYLEPGESRRATLTWPREIPFDGTPADTNEVVERYGAWLTVTEVPKLYINAQPGMIMAMPGMREFAATFPNQKTVTVAGVHFIQEDCPDQIGEAIAGWLKKL